MVHWPGMPLPRVGPALHIALEKRAHPDDAHPLDRGRTSSSVVGSSTSASAISPGTPLLGSLMVLRPWLVTPS